MHHVLSLSSHLIQDLPCLWRRTKYSYKVSHPKLFHIKNIKKPLSCACLTHHYLTKKHLKARHICRIKFLECTVSCLRFVSTSCPRKKRFRRFECESRNQTWGPQNPASFPTKITMKLWKSSISSSILGIPKIEKNIYLLLIITYWYWKNQRYLKAKGSKRSSDTKRH